MKLAILGLFVEGQDLLWPENQDEARWSEWRRCCMRTASALEKVKKR
jgi:hypothetical protein